MTELRMEAYVIPAADLGRCNPLPVFRSPEADGKIDVVKNRIPPEDRVGLGWQTGFRVLPYRMQDGYNRVKRPREFISVVLENEFLKVTVLPEIGGLVTSIIHKPLNRELLYCNPVFQPAGYALRDAWVGGGIEWNTAQPGHHYLTCSTVHTARIGGEQGYPVLRLYAWERVKCFPYQIDLHLPPKSPFLFARVRLINPHDREMPMYWWTNMGVPEYPGGRVLCPADTAYYGMEVRDCPFVKGVDYSYATRAGRAYDFFFRIPDGHRPWEAMIDADGAGMIHTSTWRLRGRKMFAFGMGQGARHWQDYLTIPGEAFQEIQAGLAYTQAHCLPMPSRTAWTWTEAVGYFECDPALTHSENWQEAYGEVERVLEQMLPTERVDRFDAESESVTFRRPDEVLVRGLGWGALENRRAATVGEQSGIPDELPFTDDDLCDEQGIWLGLLETGALPQRSAEEEPGEYMVQTEWHSLLEESLRSGTGGGWLSWYHLGVMRLENGDEDGAREAWERSVRICSNGWSLRNLSVLESRQKNMAAACEYLERAWAVGPHTAHLAIEYAGMLRQLERSDELRHFLAGLPGSIRNHERIMLNSAWLAVRSNDFPEVERVLEHEFASIREGEISLVDLWFEMQERKYSLEHSVPVDDALRKKIRAAYPPPRGIDFRMSADEESGYVPPQQDTAGCEPVQRSRERETY